MEKFGIGVDIENINRFKNKNINNSSAFLKKIFTKKELEYCFSKLDPAQHLAARYSGKEAVIKALSSLGEPFKAYKEIEILNNAKGSPIVKLYNNINKFQIEISLSHCIDKAIAFAIIIKI